MDVVRSAAEIMLPAARNAQPGPEGQVRSTATTVGELLLASAREHGDRPAVFAARRDLTHRELLLTASALAAGIAAPDPVGICVEPGWEQVVAVAAAAIAGSAWFVLDPSAPAVRTGTAWPSWAPPQCSPSLGSPRGRSGLQERPC